MIRKQDTNHVFISIIEEIYFTGFSLISSLD